MSRNTRLILIVIGAVALIAAAILTVNTLLDSYRYISTDNAQIDGDQLLVNAPTTGTLMDWRLSQGSQMSRNQTVGRIEMQGGYNRTQMTIPAPASGTVAVNNGVNGTFVAAGSQLAIAYDLSAVFVTARVDETDISQVKVGHDVDITVDAFPDTPLKGAVAEIQRAAASVFSVFPQSNTSGNFQKVTQVVAVKVTIADRKDLKLYPGMSVNVRIHKQ
ncbi:MAG: HlyD family efflux transporter periplasmic adaptor subunit [Nonomuraea sp.]|nr:HlyD family efflux transporter periplasmic adaptor subunit [Nonomuraea sp.]